MPYDFSSLGPVVDVSIGLITLAGIIAAWRTKAWSRFVNRRRQCKASKTAHEAMVSSWPSVMAFLTGAEERSTRITTEFQALNTRLDQQDSTLADIKAMQWGQLKLDPQARFVCDNTGRNLLVNTAYAKLLRVGEQSLLGFGYKNRIAADEVDAHVSKFERAAREHRPFEDTVTFQRSDYTRFLGHVRLEPYPEDPAIGPASHWFGLVTLVKELPA